ncbi:MAG: CBS domain-containing protein [Candidatus Altiarchaeota archaeon]|nr:CBS domain-containing protein [Candidatus Altiarchaeota archaeon]
MDKRRLCTIMTTQVASVSKTQKVIEAVSIMGSKNIGSVLVLDSGKLEGIITERDVLKAFSQGKDLGDTYISELMTSSVVSASPQTPVLTAAKTMVEKRFRRLPVVEAGNVLGIVTATDLVIEMDSPHITGIASEYMTKIVGSIEKTQDISTATKIMVEKNIGGLLVVDDGKPCGIITERDIIRGILAYGSRLSTVQVHELSTKDLLTVEVNNQISHICHLMHYYGVRRFPVVNSSEDVVGMITEKDLMNAMVNSYL